MVFFIGFRLICGGPSVSLRWPGNKSSNSKQATTGHGTGLDGPLHGPRRAGRLPLAKGLSRRAFVQRPLSKGPWPRAFGQGPLAKGLWPWAFGQGLLAKGLWPWALGQGLLAKGLWPCVFVQMLFAKGPWPKGPWPTALGHTGRATVPRRFTDGSPGFGGPPTGHRQA